MYDSFIFVDLFLIAYVLLLILSGLLIYVSVIRRSVKGSEYKDLEFGDDDKVYYVDYDFKNRKGGDE